MDNRLSTQSSLNHALNQNLVDDNGRISTASTLAAVPEEAEDIRSNSRASQDSANHEVPKTSEQRKSNLFEIAPESTSGCLNWRLKWPIVRDLLKASIMFMLATSLTFYEPFHKELGYGSHMAAVAILFFNPCKSVGATVEAVLTGLLGILFAICICTFSIAISAILCREHYLILKSMFLLAVMFLSTFTLAFVRARSSRPPVYTGAVIAQLIITVVLTGYAIEDHEEVNFDAIWMIVLPVLAGAFVSFLGNSLLWPTSATAELKKNISKTLNSFQILLDLLTDAFLFTGGSSFADADIPSRMTLIESYVKLHHESFIQLTQMNAEAKLEFLSRFMTSNSAYYQSAIASINRLTQHIGGMRSSVIKEEKIKSGQRLSQADFSLLMEFIDAIGPTVRVLADKCQSVLEEVNSIMQKPRPSICFFWIKDQRAANYERLHELQYSLDSALSEFNRLQKAKMLMLYEKEKFDGKPNDEVFLVYFYVFCMVEFTKELRNGLIESAKTLNKPRPSLFRRIMCCSGTIHFHSWCSCKDRLTDIDPDAYVPLLSPEAEPEIEPEEPPSSAVIQDSERYYRFLQSQTNGLYHQYLKTPFSHISSNNETAEGTNHEPPSAHPPPVPVSFFLRYRLRIWKFLATLGNSFELKFAFKTALLVFALSLLAFLPETKELYIEFRGQWAILSGVVVMTPTVGGTNVAGLYRILGTIAGALYSYLIWYIFPGQAVGLALMIWIFCVPCFFVLLHTGYPRVAQVSLVTVTSIVLAQYANIGNPEWNMDMWELSWRQGSMVSSGIVFGLIITWYVWPYEARVELRKGLSDLLLNMGIIYSRLVDVFNYSRDGVEIPSPRAMDDSFSKITPDTLHRFYYTEFDHLSPSDTLAYFMSFELKLHMSLMRLEQLVPLTWLEPRLKGPFPIEVYKQMLGCCQNILDKFVAMRVAISNNVERVSDATYPDSSSSTLKPGKSRRNSLQSIRHEDLILGIAPSSSASLKRQMAAGKSNTSLNTQTSENQALALHPDLLPYRRELVGNVLLMFYTFAGALILKQPLPTYLPPARQARKRLIERMHHVITEIEQEDQQTILNEQKRQNAGKLPFRSRTGTIAPPLIRHPQKYINYYAYALAMEDVIWELERLGILLKSLFGEIFADVVQIYDPDEELAEWSALVDDYVDFAVDEGPQSFPPKPQASEPKVRMHHPQPRVSTLPVAPIDPRPPHRSSSPRPVLTVSRSDSYPSRTSLVSPSPIHHHRADQWGRQRLQDIEKQAAVLSTYSTTSSSSSTAAMPPLASTGVNTSHGGGPSVNNGVTGSPSVGPTPSLPNADAREERAEWWRASGTWMI